MSKTHYFLRYHRIQVLAKTCRRWLQCEGEPRKVVIYCSRKVAAYHCLLHCVPLSAALALVALRWTHYWIGFNPPNATTLQFVAKLHELSMQVSIVEIVVCIVRTEAINGFVPLGALSGALQATQLSYLWSLDFWSMLHFDQRLAHRRRIRKVVIVAAIPFLLMLTALVGPSSAVLMIPEPGSPKVIHEYTTALGPLDYMFPSNLNYEYGLNMTWTNFNWTLQQLLGTKFAYNGQEVVTLFQDDMKNMTTGSDLSFRDSILRTRFRRTASDLDDMWISLNECTATIPTIFTTRLFHNYGFFGQENVGDGTYLNSTSSVRMLHPVVTTRCYENYNVKAKDYIHFIHDNGKSTGILGNVTSLASRVFDHGVMADNHNTLAYKPIWLASPEQASSTMIGVFFSSSPRTGSGNFSQKIESTSGMEGGVSYVSCSLSVFWNDAELKVIVEGPDSTVETGSVQTERIATMDTSKLKSVALNLTGLDMLWDPHFSWMIAKPKYATGLAGAFALAMAEVPTNILRLHSHKKWRGEQTSDNNVSVTAQTKAYGYGYSANSTAMSLSLVVISIYCLVSFAYNVYILVTGKASTSWNSAIEVVSLALQSKKPEYPQQGHTGAGIDSMSTFRQNVGIRVTEGNELELVFANDRHLNERGLRKIEDNTAY